MTILDCSGKSYKELANTIMNMPLSNLPLQLSGIATGTCHGLRAELSNSTYIKFDFSFDGNNWSVGVR